MTVRVRFAPSPTGYLHIGGARTALFNWLFARHHGGKYLLRIEDTDRLRSTPEAVQAIYDSLKWLGLMSDEEPVLQSERLQRHAEVAHQLLAEGKAYRCYCTPEELETMRAEATQKGLPPRYNGMWRDRTDAPANTPYAVRLRAPQTGETIINDLVQGTVCWQNSQLDDLVLLRSDGTPTYMLSVVVDDHDMGITHIIRGDDHLTNAFRQYHIYAACGWDIPQMAHIPLIHGADGAKLSKRHGALGTHEYKNMGYLSQALKNYLLRLGWGHGDEEIISQENAIAWFDVGGIGKSPSRFDEAKLKHLNGHYMRHMDDTILYDLIEPLLLEQTGLTANNLNKERTIQGMASLKERAKTLLELAEGAAIYWHKPGDHTIANQDVWKDCIAWISSTSEEWSRDTWLEKTRERATQQCSALKFYAEVLRIGLTGHAVSPPIFEVMEILGRPEVLKRLEESHVS